MPRSFNQKLKPFYVMNYLLENTDEEHTVTVNQIIAHLEAQGISAERKSIYSDIEALQVLGVDIERVDSGNYVGYYVASRTFELPELKLLVDSVQSSKFITHKKTASLIKKIEKLASIHEAQLLNRQVFVKNRIKTMNESIYDSLFNFFLHDLSRSFPWICRENAGTLRRYHQPVQKMLIHFCAPVP